MDFTFGRLSYFVIKDSNGNMTADLDRGIVAIRYNLLNLPDTVQFENGNRIVYFYYAGGERAGAVTTTYSTPISVPLDSVYLGEDPHFDMWEHRHGDLFYKMGSPSRLLFDNGFFELAERHGGLISQIPYVFVRDHLGSVRLVCNGNTGEVVQSLEYLPSGVIFRSRNFDRQPYRFTGKELLSAHGLDWYDSGARMQEFHIPRFTTMGPLCERYYSISPYAYCNNNPVKYIDPDGKDPIYTKNFWGKIKLIGDDGKNGTGSYLVRGSVAREVKRATKAGKFYTGDLSENKKVMHIPTGQKLEGVKQSYEDTKISQKENGGHANIGDANVTRWDEGPAAISFTDKDGNQGAKASLQMFVVNGKNTMPTDASNVEMWWHTHPNTTVNGISLGNSTPSDADYSGQKTMTNRGYKGNTFVIGIRSKKVTFFNKDGVLTTVKWEDFLRMGGQKK